MRRHMVMAVFAGVVLMYAIERAPMTAQSAPTRVAAVPSEKGGQDVFGAYEVVAGWPKKLTHHPGTRGLDVRRGPERVRRKRRSRSTSCSAASCRRSRGR